MHFIQSLQERGLIQDMSDEKGLKNLKAGDSFYVGFDPTAPSLQLGNLVPIIVAVHLAKAGLKPVILFGGATGAIGDPKNSTERPLLTREQIESNVKNHQRIVKRIIDKTGVASQFVDNYDWTKEMSFIDFLRDIGKHFTVNYMVSKEVVKTRMSGEGISYTEFSYMLLQANDYFHLNKNFGCKLQIGGSDQWGNITAGLELLRRKGVHGTEAFSIPLITDSAGKKFGKSEGNALWLDEKDTSPYKMHQFWLNTSDSDVIKYIKIFTFADEAKIQELTDLLKSAPEKRAAQNFLADSVTELLHGEAATEEARRSAQVLFGGAVDNLSVEQLSDIFSESPSSSIARDKISQMSYIDLVVETKLAKSKGDARRLVESGGAYLNNERISDVNLKLVDFDSKLKDMLILRSGKKNYHLVKII